MEDVIAVIVISIIVVLVVAVASNMYRVSKDRVIVSREEFQVLDNARREVASFNKMIFTFENIAKATPEQFKEEQLNLLIAVNNHRKRFD